MYAMVDEHRHSHGVESICKLLQIAPSAYRRHAARLRNASLEAPRTQRDQQLMPHIERVWKSNLCVYGADKVWQQLRREGIKVARCTVERLMRSLGLQGVRRGKVVRTTLSPYESSWMLCSSSKIQASLFTHLIPATPKSPSLIWSLNKGTRICILASKAAAHISLSFANAASF